MPFETQKQKGRVGIAKSINSVMVKRHELTALEPILAAFLIAPSRAGSFAHFGVVQRRYKLLIARSGKIQELVQTATFGSSSHACPEQGVVALPDGNAASRNIITFRPRLGKPGHAGKAAEVVDPALNDFIRSAGSPRGRGDYIAAAQDIDRR
jgi:hypothetical protein